MQTGRDSFQILEVYAQGHILVLYTQLSPDVVAVGVDRARERVLASGPFPWFQCRSKSNCNRSISFGVR